MCFYPCDFLLPKSNFEKWAVVACDQYTSEPEYWKEVEEFVGEEPSALKIILPEVYLQKDNSERISKINATMKKYIYDDFFTTIKDTFIYVEREVTGNKTRKGIIGLIKLDDYSYEKNSNALIRATEATVIERIPPRVEIRKDALLELPHVMLLIDDKDNTVIETLSQKTDNFNKVYDFDLMQNSGHIKGYSLDKNTVCDVQAALKNLVDKSGDNFLFAVGDGNHSLATAKECKSEYAMVEVVNIHDLSLEFEPLYRVLFGVNPKEVIEKFVTDLGDESHHYTGDDAQIFTCVFGDEVVKASVKPTGKLPISTLQKWLDEYILTNTDIKVDYIHGEDVVYSLAKQPNTLGFIFDGMQKSELFPAIKQDGSLPRKTFSMGNACDKRFYIEARLIK